VEEAMKLVMRVAIVVLFWALAAVLISLAPSLAAKVFVIVAVSLGYMKVAARGATIEHAILVGVTWLTLGIVAEMVTRSFALLNGNVLLICWIAAPALFARSATAQNSI
jgi:accessory gene regulator protein AgrB